MKRRLSTITSWAAPIAILAVAFMLPGQAFAATLTASQTVANVAEATVPAITFAGGTATTSATATLTAVATSSLVANDYFILSHTGVAATAVCFYFDVADALASDAGTAVDCQNANGVAGGVELDVNDATSSAAVATIIHTAVNGVGAQLTVTSTNNGNGTLTLTNDTAGAAGNIAVNAAYWTEAVANGTFALTALAGATNSTAATATIAIPSGMVANPTDHSVTIDGVTINLGTSVLTATQVATAIASATYTSGTNYGTGAYTATSSVANVTYTKTSVGTAGNGAVTIADNLYGGVSQTVTFSPGDVDGNDDFIITINGTDYVQNHGADNVKEAVDLLTELLAADTAVSCTDDDVTITCVARTPGTAFTYSTSVESNGQSSGHRSSGGGGGGGSSHSSSSPSMASLESMLTELKAKLAALLAAKGNTTAAAAVSGSFSRDLEIGATGADVMALQKYLNAHGFVVSASGAGSVGNETSMFGAATQAALAKWQASVGIAPAAGYFGPKTRAYVTAHP